MKILLLLLFSCKVLLADNAAYILPERVQFDYPDETGLVLEADDSGKVGFLSITMGKKRIAVDAAELASIFNPDLSKVHFQQTYDERLKSKIWIVSFEYGRRIYEWGAASNKVKFIFDETGYNSRIIERPTTKDTWETLTKLPTRAETRIGIGGNLESVDQDGLERPSQRLKAKSDTEEDSNATPKK